MTLQSIKFLTRRQIQGTKLNFLLKTVELVTRTAMREARIICYKLLLQMKGVFIDTH